MTELWHDECRRLRAEGLSQPEIAARLRLPRGAIARLLNENEEQKIIFRRAREIKRRKPRPAASRKKKGNRFQTYWTARAAAPGKITPDIKREAILAFSKHEIDRAELMKRITPRSKWRNM